MINPIIVNTVLKSGGNYKPEHVLRMCEMLDKHIDYPIKFVCHSDMDIPGINISPLEYDLPGWWSKLEIFKHNKSEFHNFYIDLDMTIQKNITDIVSYESNFITLRNLNPVISGFGTAMIGWKSDMSFIFREFKKHSTKIMEMYDRRRTGTPYLGDQGFLYALISGEYPFDYSEESSWFKNSVEFYQDVFPKRISKFSLNPDADVLVYFGRNKPWL